VDAAADAGADAVKFQTFRASHLATRDAPGAAYQKRGLSEGESQYEMLRRLELSDEAHRRLVERCRRRDLLFMSTAFDEPSADLLDELAVPLYKIPSGEVTNLPFLARMARRGRPMLVSTGMCTLGEVESAVETLEEAGNRNFVLLHCVSSYPADPGDVNLRAMHTLAAAFECPVGYSDHTPGIEVGIAAVALGACVLEKHFTLDRSLPGPDHAASLQPDELQALVRGIRTTEAAIGRREAG
jgi:N,N'-diacetyllegionaminate synthase